MTRRISVLGLAILALVGCTGPTSVDKPAPDRPVPWVENAWTQPVPSWGSPVRLDLPVPLPAILLGVGRGIGAFGAHEGGHVEGLNHVWIEIAPGTTVCSWANGTVKRIDDMGERVPDAGRHEFFITIDYGQGLVGQHMDVDSALVRAGDRVRAGDPVAVAPSAEFLLIDNNRTDGERTGGSTGSPVSPFDYLRDEVKAALLARYLADVVAPYFSSGRSSGSSRPWEPSLTNRMLSHAASRGDIVGEWILLNKGWRVVDPTYYDVLTVFDETNEYGTFRRLEMGDHDWSMPGSKRVATGTWEAGDTPGRIVVATDRGDTRFGLYSVDESTGRARLTLEWQQGAFPSAIGPNAAVYVERSAIYLWEDARRLGIIG